MIILATIFFLKLIILKQLFIKKIIKKNHALIKIVSISRYILIFSLIEGEEKECLLQNFFNKVPATSFVCTSVEVYSEKIR